MVVGAESFFARRYTLGKPLHRYKGHEYWAK